MNLQTKAFIALLEKVGWVKKNISTKRNGKYSKDVYEYKEKVVVVLDDSYCLEKTVNKKTKSAGIFKLNEEHPHNVQLLLNAF